MVNYLGKRTVCIVLVSQILYLVLVVGLARVDVRINAGFGFTKKSVGLFEVLCRAVLRDVEQVLFVFTNDSKASAYKLDFLFD